MAWRDALLMPCADASSSRTATGLTAESIGAWLASRQILGARRVAKIDLLSGRAFAALVRFDDGSALFLKQPIEAIPPVGALREGLLLRLIADNEDLRGVRAFLPEHVLYDETDNVAVSRGLPEHRSMHDRSVPPSDELLRATARSLATLHCESSSVRIDTSRYYAINPVFDYARISPASFARAPGIGFGTFLAAMQALEVPLRAVADAWSPSCLIHGDLRDDNILVADRRDADPPIAFVDWELGGWGDPLWDLGAWIGQYLYYWVESIKAGSSGDFSDWVRGAGIPFAEIKRAVRAILASYAETAGDCERTAGRALQLAGVFLLNRVLGSLESVGAIHAAAFCSLQVGRTLVAQPERVMGIFT
jgi:thiamine kinase-like enzyme